MNKQKLKSNHGVSMADFIIAMFILILFVGVIGAFYYQIVRNNTILQMDALAAYYAVKIAEEIDKKTYEEVNHTLMQTIQEDYSIPDSFTIAIEVEKYNKEDTSKKDILKTASIKIEYECLKEKRIYELQKLKVKEREKKVVP